MIGTILHDRWRILSVLGHGAMGEVFLAEHVRLRRKEALKILMPVLATDPLFVAQFRREARAVNRLRHPNIVSLYDFGQLPDGRFFLSMEYADGSSLQQHLHRGRPFVVPRALQLLGQLVYAVHHAHSRSVVHRDLKPENLIIVDGEQEVLKVLDFGFAKIVAESAESIALSGGEDVWGTPTYMSPERATGVGDDPRSDLYSIGCIAYELLVGAPPFLGATPDVLFAHFNKVPTPPRHYRGDISPELEAIVLTCLEKDPVRRFQSAADLFAALRKLADYPQPKPLSRRRFVPSAPSASGLGDVARGTIDPGAYGQLRGALRRLAEALLDRGVADPRLVSGVAILRDHEQVLARLEAAQDALEHEADALRQTVADREASLRFALGELTLGDPNPPPEQVRELQARLAAVVAEGDLVQTFDRSLEDLAVARAAGLAELQTAYDTLETIVNEILPEHLEDDAIHTLAASLALVRAQRNMSRPGPG